MGLPTGAQVHDDEELLPRLEGGMHGDNERVLRHTEDVPLGQDVFHVRALPPYQALRDDLHGEDVGRAAVADLQHLAEGPCVNAVADEFAANGDAYEREHGALAPPHSPMPMTFKSSKSLGATNLPSALPLGNGVAASPTAAFAARASSFGR